MECRYCKKTCQKAGKQVTGKQKYRCMGCKKYQQSTYVYTGYKLDIEYQLVRHMNRGCGIRDLSYLLEISTTTVIRKIREISKDLDSGYSGTFGMKYEMDELRTYVGSKCNETWVMYGINRYTQEVLGLKVGRRTKENLKTIVDRILKFSPKHIFTDGLNSYPGLIPMDVHKPGRYYTNRIERMNLNLRTHLKRLSRSTICYSKKMDMLEACLKIYFWIP